MHYGTKNCAMEITFTSGKTYPDPFNDVELDVVFTDPDGVQHKVPCFWAGDHTWIVRYAPSKTGIYHYVTSCSDEDNSDLHGMTGKVEVNPYDGTNPLVLHGKLRVAQDRRHLEHEDGTPFFWLADTWWMGLVKRLRYPDEFKTLVADRVMKGFTVIQIVAGLYPDMDQFDERGANEAGFPWTKDYKQINPSYFDMADLRISCLVRSGLVPCIVACWGYYMDFVGVEILKKHWRNLIARYGAYPVVWCVAGEAIMPYYLAPADKRSELIARAKSGWTEVTRYIREIDPYHHPITIHPTDVGRKQVEDPSLLDIDMLQTGHGGWDSMPNTVNKVMESLEAEPKMPVIVGEVSYEGIGGRSSADVQRFAFWSSVLTGSAGHTYGANGIWQVNTHEKPFGPSPHGMSWGNTPWEEAYRLPGSTQLGIAKSIITRYPWWQFKAHPEWVENHATKDRIRAPYAAGIPENVRIIYIPDYTSVLIKNIEPQINYRAFYVDPMTGTEYDLGKVAPDDNNNWRAPRPPIFQDWILVLERQR